MVVLQDRHFRSLWYVGSLNELCRRMELLVLSWLILQTTNSPFQLGLVLVFNHLPRLLISPFAGVIADRISRKRILVAAQTVNSATAAVILALIMTEQIVSWHVFVAVALHGTTKALEDPARRTAILDIVGSGRLVNALSLDTMSNTVGKMAGPLMFGVLVDTTGNTGAYIFILILHLLTLAAVLTRVHIPPVQQALVREPVWRSLGAAVEFARHDRMLVGMLYVTIVMNAMAFPAQQFIPAIGRDHLLVGATLVGLLAAAEGLGQMAGAFLMAVTRNLRRHGLVFAIGSVVVLLIGICFVWSPWYGLTFALLTIGGIGQAGFGTMQSTITMLAAPPAMRGRMVGLMSVCIGAGTPLGTLEIGALAVVFGTQASISANAILGLVLMAPALLFTPLLWRPTTTPAASPRG
ncbi:MAG: MFS transporter [Dehalococcoidia bacterium]|nr:MFS transporter [Dehalococcoidia bacterium]MSQ16154.1 MFS transporter [Dehalococcoidia bacterium]